MKLKSEILKRMFGIKGHKGGEERRGEGKGGRNILIICHTKHKVNGNLPHTKGASSAQ